MSAEEAAIHVDGDGDDHEDEQQNGDDDQSEYSSGDYHEDEQQDGDDDQSEYSYGDYDSDYSGADMEAAGPTAASRAAAAASQPGVSAVKSKGE